MAVWKIPGSHFLLDCVKVQYPSVHPIKMQVHSYEPKRFQTNVKFCIIRGSAILVHKYIKMKQMKNRSVLFAFIILVMGSSCKKTIGEGATVTEQRSTGNFTGIELSIPATVNFSQAPNYKVEISGQQNVLNIIETYVSGSRLVIKIKNKKKLGRHDAITATITAPALNSLRVAGSGNLNTSGSLSPTLMNLDISGSGNITMDNLATNMLDANISGSGNITIATGTATKEKLQISGSGNMELQNIVANKVTTTTSGSGEMRVHAVQNLAVTISGSGSVFYKGSPIIATNISGSGKVGPF